MKTLVTAVFFFTLLSHARGQKTLTLSDCYERAKANYPLIRREALIESTRTFSMDNASKGHLPQITFAGQATYQSDVTRIPIEMPGIVPLDKDQYRIFAEVSQALYHGGLVKQQVRGEALNAEVERGQLAVDLYQLRSRVNDLFFGILLLQAQLRQSALVKEDLNSALRKTEAGLANGVAIRSAADVLRAESLRADERAIELQAGLSAYREMLGTFIGGPLADDVMLEKPQLLTVPDESVQRPELHLFDLQKQRIDASMDLMSAGKKPKLELFIQGGYGRPGLNMLDNDFASFYLGGVRLSWLLSGYYTFGKEKQLLALREQSLDVQKEIFLFNTQLAARQQNADVSRLQKLIKVDEDIIALRRRVKQTASVQLEEGVVSASDYVREVNAADQAEQNRVLHETQLLMAEAKYQFTIGHQ
jgi:outer membrane protein TolC